MKTSFLACLLVGAAHATAQAQAPQAEPGNWPLIVTAFSEAWALPSTNLIQNPIHPGLSVGTAYNLRSRRASTIYVSGTLGYFYHKNLQHNLHLIGALNYEYRPLAGLHLGAGIGVGYSHSIYPTPVYKLKEGEYRRSADWGTPSMMPSLDVNAGYTVGRGTARPATLFAKYQLLVQWPYAPENTIPLLPHTAFHVGVRFHPFN